MVHRAVIMHVGPVYHLSRILYRSTVCFCIQRAAVGVCLIRRVSPLADNPGCWSRGCTPQGLCRGFAGSRLAVFRLMKAPSAGTLRDPLRPLVRTYSLCQELFLCIALDAGQRHASCA